VFNENKVNIFLRKPKETHSEIGLITGSYKHHLNIFGGPTEISFGFREPFIPVDIGIILYCHFVGPTLSIRGLNR